MNGNIIAFQDGTCPQTVRRIVRIMGLLGELEELTTSARALPLPLLLQTRKSIEKARRVLNSCAAVESPRLPPESDEGDPQPDIDREMLERMYKNL
jgi:hypothetical protein